MGWKAIKDHYRIGHNVMIDERGLCIGTGYISDIIVINEAGTIIKRYDDRSNEDLRRYQSEMDADPEKLKELLFSEDTFIRSIPVWTYDGAGEVVEKFCEELHYPNVTHDGFIMYDNTFSQDKLKIAKRAKENTRLGIEQTNRYISRLENDIKKAREEVDGYTAELAKLESDFPDSEPASA